MKPAGSALRGRPGRIFASFILLLAARTALAQDPAGTTYQIANQMEGWYNTEDRETVLDNRLDTRVAHGPYAIGATFLSHSPSDDQRLDPNDFGPQQQGLRKRWIEATTDRFALRAGDVYATFGRGLALAVFEDQTVDFDNVLDGAWGKATLGRADLEIIGGTNSHGAAGVVLKGARATVRPFEGRQNGLWSAVAPEIGVTGTWADYPQGTGGSRTGGDRLFGGSGQGRLGSYADLYGEYVLRDRRGAVGEDAGMPQGHAGYASANLYLGRLQLVGEYKDLLRYDLPLIDNRAFVVVPPCARQHATTLLNRGGHTPNIFPADERGGLVEGYLSVREHSRLTGAYSRTLGRHTGLGSWEVYSDLEHWFGPIELVARGAESEETFVEGTDRLFFERITWGGTCIAPLGRGWTLDLTAESQETQERKLSAADREWPLEYRETVVSLTVSNASGMSWALTGETTDDDRQDRDQWLWAEWNIRLGERHQLLLGGGRLRGGQVCSGGVCKLVDKFEGGRFELLTTF